jgi:hypothetical protein
VQARGDPAGISLLEEAPGLPAESEQPKRNQNPAWFKDRALFARFFLMYEHLFYLQYGQDLLNAESDDAVHNQSKNSRKVEAVRIKNNWMENALKGFKNRFAQTIEQIDKRCRIGTKKLK